ncbi:hypothetical protein D3C71_1806890 [compost metagenome]
MDRDGQCQGAFALGRRRHGLNAVHQQIDDDLLKLHPVAFDIGQVGRSLLAIEDAVVAHLALQQGAGLLCRDGERKPGALALALLRKTAHAADDVGRAAAVGHDMLNAVRQFRAVQRFARQPSSPRFAIGDHGGEGLIDFMRD